MKCAIPGLYGRKKVANVFSFNEICKNVEKEMTIEDLQLNYSIFDISKKMDISKNDLFNELNVSEKFNKNGMNNDFEMFKKYVLQKDKEMHSKQ